MRLASSRAGTLSSMRPSRIRRGGPAALGMAVWPMQTCLSRLLTRSRVWGGTTPVHVAAARSSRSAAFPEAHSGRPLRACYEDSSSDPFCLATLTKLLDLVLSRTDHPLTEVGDQLLLAVVAVNFQE